MKTFKDLQFTPHPYFPGGSQGRLFFPNGYGVSVINGQGAYVSAGTYELAVLKGTEESSRLTYDTSITNDVIGHLTPDEVSETMKRVQELPAESV